MIFIIYLMNKYTYHNDSNHRKVGIYPSVVTVESK
jgi:hypothetical protein